ncbi:unnamed protein product [Heterobilharzia americana]|nr:unnamed protein product [Heterobilharzia americana]
MPIEYCRAVRQSDPSNKVDEPSFCIHHWLTRISNLDFHQDLREQASSWSYHNSDKLSEKLFPHSMKFNGSQCITKDGKVTCVKSPYGSSFVLL